MDGSTLSNVLIKLAIVLLLVLANGFFVASEFALVSVRRSRIAALVADGNKRARAVLRVIEHRRLHRHPTGITWQVLHSDG